jgi:hypothetical protein
MDTEALKAKMLEYGKAKIQIKHLEDRLEELKPEIVGGIRVVAPDDGIVDTDFGIFTLSEKRTYVYSEEVETLTKRLKALKKDQEATGEATYVTNPSIRFDEKIII